MEEIPSKEKIISPEKAELLVLEATGQYVFHGSDKDLERLEPRQAHNHIKGEKIPDGEPGVFASSKADYAIFMAIMNNAPSGSFTKAGAQRLPGKDLTMYFGATQKTIGGLPESASGWVYVFNKTDFTQRNPQGVEFVSHQRLAPVKRVLVHRNDLPESIEIIEDEGAPMQ